MHHNNPRLKTNNFDLLRLLFAGTVCLVHAHQVSGFQELAYISRFLSSEIAVKSFFIVSGFLIFMSFERSSSLLSYTEKRIRRIYPAYFTIVMICAIGLLVVSSESTKDYFSTAWLKYVIANLSFLNFLQPSLPGVFTSNHLGVVNGALWTLKIEAMFYFTVPFFVFLFRKFSHFHLIIIVYCASVIYNVLLQNMAIQTGSDFYNQLARQLPGQLSYFMAGAFLFYFLKQFEKHVGSYLLIATVILGVNMVYPLPLFEPFALAVVVVFFGLFLYMGNFGKYGDFSYGVYIIHFPVIQILLNGGWFRHQPWFFLLTVTCLTLIGAILMWHLVEKRFLLRRNHYIAATLPATENTSK